jgi:hypothetical protein
MEDYVLNFLKAEWKVSDTNSTHWASDLNSYEYQEIAHIYLQDNLFGVVDIAFTSNEGYHRFYI